MKQPKHIVIIAGEESGDIYASQLAKELWQSDPSLEISGIGGKHMQQAGIDLVNDLASHGVTGLTEVVKHLWILHKAMQQIKQHLRAKKPDLLILVDYPGFNLRLAKYAKQQLSLKILYYISPQIWAWKANRIHSIRQNVDHMAVILPFEKKIYQKSGVTVSFVGHPLSELIIPKEPQTTIREQLQLPFNKTIIALLPGSRGHEIEKHMPVFMELAAQLNQEKPNLHFVIAISKTLSKEQLQTYVPHTLTNISFIDGQARAVIASSECVIVSSGTASLECALLARPMCIVYKGSWLSYMITMQVIKVKYFGLCNLLWNKMVVPELLQYDCTKRELLKITLDLLNPASHLVKREKKGFETLHAMLASDQVDITLPELVFKMLDN